VGSLISAFGLAEQHFAHSDESTLSQRERPLWEQLVAEVSLHLHSPDFREEFYALVRNDEIYISLFSLHLVLLSDRLRKARVGIGSDGLFKFAEHQRTMLRLGARRYSSRFYQNAYNNWHSHLPEELFYEDFVSHFKRSNAAMHKSFLKAFHSADSTADDDEALLKKAVHEDLLKKAVREDHPIVAKLVLYIEAHRTYLSSLTYEELSKVKVNWGLK